VYTTIIFDLDGTLLDTLSGIATTCNIVLAKQGFPLHPIEDYRYFVGEGLKALMEKITPAGTGKDTIDACCGSFTELYADHWKNSCTVYAGMAELLLALRKNGFRLAVLSNKPHAFTSLIVEDFFPGQIFSLVYGHREGFARKPDPAVALEIAAKLGAQPAETIFIGDSGVDIRTGKAAGMLTVGVTWGFRRKAELQENQADLIINSPMELLHHVLPAT
jgi:phosphoglycolate phosphatase